MTLCSLKTEEQVVLVTPDDRELGTMGKLQAHREGVLHRAFSVLIFNTDKELLLQRRAGQKYHGGGLWTNTCCSHPRPGESYSDAAHRRLREEMGLECPLVAGERFVYRAEMPGGLIEHELDQLYTGICNGPVQINPEEVSEYRYCSVAELQSWMKSEPEQFTPWFHIIAERFL